MRNENLYGVRRKFLIRFSDVYQIACNQQKRLHEKEVYKVFYVRV